MDMQGESVYQFALVLVALLGLGVAGYVLRATNIALQESNQKLRAENAWLRTTGDAWRDIAERALRVIQLGHQVTRRAAAVATATRTRDVE